MSTLGDNMQAVRDEIERQRAEAARAREQQDIKRAAHIIYATIPLLERKLQYLSRVH